ncbi:MAG: PHP domain-containing protein, partial [Kangiellaceae bacterium]|nr:PHP domain-containing protein [Kangiellaceae bacterium]
MQINAPHTIDLHCHSSFSDGSLPVEQLIEHFKAHGVTDMAITDHDSVGAHYRVAELKKSQPELFNQLNVIGGIEISTQFNNREIHIVGLGIDVYHDGLVEFVEQQQSARRQRLSEYAAKLEGLGCRGVTDAVNSLSAESVTR